MLAILSESVAQRQLLAALQNNEQPIGSTKALRHQAAH